MDYKRIFKDGIHLVAGKIGTVVVSLIDMMILTRILTTEQMGKYSLFLMVVNLALVLGFNWSDSSIVRHGREEYVRSNKINQSFWARTYLFFPIMVFFVLIFAIFNKQITAYVGIDPRLIVTLIVMFVLNGLLNFITYIYQSIDQMKKSAYVLLSQKVFYLMCLSLVFFNIFKVNFTIILILINVSFLLSILINIFLFDFKKIFPYAFNKEYFKKIWAYSWPQLIGFPGLYIINYIDLFVIKKYYSLHEVGVYSVAYNGFTIICGFIMLIYTVLFPLMIEYRTKKDFDLIKKYTSRIPRLAIGWAALALVGTLLSQYIIPLAFSDKYVEAIPAFNVLLLASIFYFVSVCLLPIVNAFDLIIYSQIFNIIKAVANIIADFLLVPSMGIKGAAYGTLISYATGMLLTGMLLFIKRKTIFADKNESC